MRVTNGIQLGCPLLLPVCPVNSVQIRKVTYSCEDVVAVRRSRRATVAIISTAIGFTEGGSKSATDAETGATAVAAAAASQLTYDVLVVDEVTNVASVVTSTVASVFVDQKTVAQIITAADEQVVERDAKIVAAVAEVVVTGKAGKAGKSSKGDQSATVATANAVEATVVLVDSGAFVAKAGKESKNKKDGKGTVKAAAISASQHHKNNTQMVGIAAGVVVMAMVTVGAMLFRTRVQMDKIDTKLSEVVVDDFKIAENTPLLVV
jgi:hypothetical protein